MTEEKQFTIIAAIDFGTSNSGYAYAFTNDKHIEMRYQWPDQYVPHCKTLTKSLYNREGNLEAWGCSAVSRWTELLQQQQNQDYNLFENFKMALRTSNERTDDGSIADIGNNGLRLSVMNLVADYLCKLKELLIEELTKVTVNNLRLNEILWCLTIPAIWRDQEKVFMRRAAIQAGLITDSNSDRDRLFLILEPEAAAVYCQKKKNLQLKEGNSFMVVDCGGGTVDITVHEVSSDGRGLNELVRGIGIPYGGTNVDRRFREFFTTKLDSEPFARYIRENPISWEEFMANQWERKKRAFDPQINRITKFEIPNPFYTILSQDYPQILQELANRQSGERTHLHFSRETMQEIFQPGLDNIVQLINDQLEQLTNNTCDYLYLVGGFSESPALQQRIMQEFNDRIEIIIPSNPGEAILRGAVSLGLDPTIIRSRRSRLTYGISRCDLFDENIHYDRKDQAEKHPDPQTEGLWIKNIFVIFVAAGQEIQVNESKTEQLIPHYPDQTAMRIHLYLSTKNNPRYINESSDEEKLAEIVVDISSTLGRRRQDREIEVLMKFGQSEIEVEVKDMLTGQIVPLEQPIWFSSTYSIE